jgi:hypothetical protein
MKNSGWSVIGPTFEPSTSYRSANPLDIANSDIQKRIDMLTTCFGGAT